jgi:hypothetical protein
MPFALHNILGQVSVCMKYCHDCLTPINRYHEEEYCPSCLRDRSIKEIAEKN